MPLLLELFKGTGSYSKVAEQLGIDVISLDIMKKFNPTICMSILDWDYTTIDIPDIITASPPCETFSRLIATHKNKVRNYLTDMKPLNAKGELGDAVLLKTIEIIKYFLEKNPNLKFVIENPVGFMRRMPCMSEPPILNINTCWYSFYGMPYRKPTDFWSNVPDGLNLKPYCKKDEPPTTTYICSIPLKDRYRIPTELVIDILNALLGKKKHYLINITNLQNISTPTIGATYDI
jgi:hypothetical protein